MKNNSKKSASSKKRDGILQSALEVFLELGYGDTTIDEIVKRAGGSKATVYKHFKNKEQLFATVIDEVVRHRPTVELNRSLPPEKALLAFAELRLKAIFTRKHNVLRRLVIGEAKRFPKIARLYYEHGVGMSIKQLAEYLEEESSRNRLKVEDPHTAAILFTSMLTHDLFSQAVYNVIQQPSGKQIKLHARDVVNTFLLAFGKKD